MVNVFAAVVLGPWWGVAIAFCASLLRNLLGIGSLMAFPGSMVGALCCGLVYHFSKRISLTCVAEALGTGVLGGLAAYPIAKLLWGWNRRVHGLYAALLHLHRGGQRAGLCAAEDFGEEPRAPRTRGVSG